MWNFTAKTEKIIIIEKKKRINWYRYQKKIYQNQIFHISFINKIQILILKLLKFAQKCKKDRPDTIVMKNKVSTHASQYQKTVYILFDIFKMLWCDNFLNLNMIKLCWSWMKCQITRKDPPKTRKKAEKRWLYCWKYELIQKRIQRWIKRISKHIAEIIRFKGDNEYKKRHHDNDIRPYNSNAKTNNYIFSYMKHHHWMKLY